MREFAVVVSNDNEKINPIETIDAICQAGFKNVFIQWYNKQWDYSQQDQLEYIKKRGLKIIFAHLGYQNINEIWNKESKIGRELVERYKKDIKICKENDIPMVVMHLTSHFVAPMYNEVGLNRIREIVDYAKKLNVKIAFENTKIKGYLEYVLDHIKDENVGICFDAGHCHVHFQDNFDFNRFKDRIFAVHLHDNDQSDDLHLIPFEGTINWKNYIKALKENHYDGPVTLELCYRYHYLEVTPLEFYQKGYQVAETLAKMFDTESNKER